MAGPILIVEDNPDIRATLRQLFEMEGFEVELAADGEDALRRLDPAGPPCLILLDLAMPRMDGWQFLAELHGRDGALAQTPVVVLSAQCDDATAQDLKHRFGCRVVAKPAPIRTLLNVARRCREGERLRTEAQASSSAQRA